MRIGVIIMAYLMLFGFCSCAGLKKTQEPEDSSSQAAELVSEPIACTLSAFGTQRIDLTGKIGKKII